MDRSIIRTLIVDDEPLARDGVRLQLVKDPEFEVVGECGNGRDAVDAIRCHRPNLVFLDVRMPGLDGFELLGRLKPDELPIIVFVTAFDAFALKAFEVHALDYVLKPIDPERFNQTLSRVKEAIRTRRTADLTTRLLASLESLKSDLGASVSAPAYLTRFTLREADRIYFVSVDDVDWIESADYYVKLHAGKQSHLLRETLSHLESQLDPTQFVRIHRSTTVRLNRIKEIRKQADGEAALVLLDGTELRFGRSYRDKLDDLLRDLPLR
jgi:two-component system, LytTR family, response regulator